MMQDDSLIKKMARSIEHATENINDYDEFLRSWQSLVANNDNQVEWEQTDCRKIEQFAVSALLRLAEENDQDQVGFISNPLLNSMGSSALIVDAKGCVLAANLHATSLYSISRGVDINTLGFRLETGQSLTAKIFQFVNQEEASENLTLLQVFTDAEAMVPLVIVRSEQSGAPQALLIIMDTPCSDEMLNLFSVKFGLTDAESGVVRLFVSGMSLKKIAQIRERSYTTIRNQFQTILEKTACPTQVELLRLLLSVSYLISFAVSVSSEETQGASRKVVVKRPQQRSVEVNVYGDPDGSPIVVLPSLFGIPATQEIEQILVARSIRLIGIWRPGFAETTDVLPGDNLYQCLAEDISAVLDQQGIASCPVVGRASAARSMFNLANLIPERITQVCIVNSLVPIRYISKKDKVSRWASALISASKISPSFAALILKTGKNLMMRNGAKHFIENMYRSSAADESAVKNHEVAMSIYKGTIRCAEQGFSAAARDMIEGFEDWSAEVGEPTIPIKLLQGCGDPQVPIEAARAFAADYPEIIELVEFAEGGGLLNYTHFQAIMDVVFERTSA